MSDSTIDTDDYSSGDSDFHESLRRNVRELCGRFPDAYWRDLEAGREYPEEFVRTLTRAGYLASLIPEQYGGAGLGITEAAIILEEINRSGGNAAACHAQMYIMGDAAASRVGGSEAEVSAVDCQRRPSPAGVRRHRADDGLGHHAVEDDGGPQGRPLRRQRPEGVHLPRGTLRSAVAAGADDAHRSR